MRAFSEKPAEKILKDWRDSVRERQTDTYASDRLTNTQLREKITLFASPLNHHANQLDSLCRINWHRAFTILITTDKEQSRR